jgi:hypothetical protein
MASIVKRVKNEISEKLAQAEKKYGLFESRTRSGSV